jgi:hypothetical protein
MVSVPDLIRLDGEDLIRVTLTVADTAHEVNVRADTRQRRIDRAIALFVDGKQR